MEQEHTFVSSHTLGISYNYDMFPNRNDTNSSEKARKAHYASLKGKKVLVTRVTVEEQKKRSLAERTPRTKLKGRKYSQTTIDEFLK